MPTQQVQKILDAVSQLKDVERDELISHLLEETGPDEAWEKAWAEEAAVRGDELLSSPEIGLDADHVMAEGRARLKRLKP
jgi:hypothetical protein